MIPRVATSSSSLVKHSRRFCARTVRVWSWRANYVRVPPSSIPQVPNTWFNKESLNTAKYVVGLAIAEAAIFGAGSIPVLALWAKNQLSIKHIETERDEYNARIRKQMERKAKLEVRGDIRQQQKKQQVLNQEAEVQRQIMQQQKKQQVLNHEAEVQRQRMQQQKKQQALNQEAEVQRQIMQQQKKKQVPEQVTEVRRGIMLQQQQKDHVWEEEVSHRESTPKEDKHKGDSVEAVLVRAFTASVMAFLRALVTD